jgi:NAD(P)-dependent dehydrogenase (short-subunit alcohol dehydrogenase family)
MESSTILITGATAGIGRHAALHLAGLGHRVIASGRRMDVLADLVAESGGDIVPLQLDVDDPAAVPAAAAEIDRLTGGRGIDILINNAGYATAGALVELADHHLRAQFETNVFGLMAVTRAMLPAMIARGRGRIINIGSVSGRIPAPVLGAYHASKYALEALSDALRMELGPLGIGVVVIEPGTIRTGFANRTKSEIAKTRPARSHYDGVYARIEQIEARFMRMAADPVHVTRAISQAVRARKPCARYVAPRRFLALIAVVKLLPTAWVDFVMKRVFGLDRLQPNGCRS